MADYLDRLTQEKVTLTFGRIEKIIGKPLPPSAREYPPFWANDKRSGGKPCERWMRKGWLSANVNVVAGRITFVRPAGRPAADSGDGGGTSGSRRRGKDPRAGIVVGFLLGLGVGLGVGLAIGWG